MAPDTRFEESYGIEERLIDLVGDAIGGSGSFSLLEGGSTDQRHTIISHVLTQAEEMGCLTVICDCAHPTSGIDPLAKALSALRAAIEGRKEDPSSAAPEAWSSDRSYRREMDGLALLRSIAAVNTAVVVVEEIGSAPLDTIALIGFLARNVRGMGVTIIATVTRPGEDPILSDMLDRVRFDGEVYVLRLSETEGYVRNGGPPAQHPAPAGWNEAPSCPGADMLSAIECHIASSEKSIMSGATNEAIGEARDALKDSIAMRQFGSISDSYVALATALTQAGRECEALDAIDRAIDLSRVIGEPLSQRDARLRKAELLLFSIGEPDSALKEASIAEDIGARRSDRCLCIEPLALKAIIEAGNGRRDRAEQIFCQAIGALEGQPDEACILERMLLALAAALLMESRHDLAGMNARYGEAEVLATGTSSPIYWSAILSLQRARSLLRLRRPREARTYLERSAQLFEALGNEVQHTRAKRVAKESEAGPPMD
jgi:tetratricopeptide (TPR) repeat protein